MTDEGSGQGRGPNNPIGANFRKQRIFFTQLWREESLRVAIAQDRVRFFRDMADQAGALESFYSDERVNELERSGRSDFLGSASASAVSGAEWAESELRTVQDAVQDFDTRRYDVSSVSYSHHRLIALTSAVAQQEGLGDPLADFRLAPLGPDLSKPAEIRVREMLSQLSEPLAEQHERAWALFREGIDSSIKAAYHLHRDTFREVVQMVAPEEAVVAQEWYERPTDTNFRTTHAQRMRYIREAYATGQTGTYVGTVVEQLDRMEADLYRMTSKKGAHRDVASDPPISLGEVFLDMTLYDAYMIYALEPVIKRR